MRWIAALNALAGANPNSAITQLESALRPQLPTEMHEIQVPGPTPSPQEPLWYSQFSFPTKRKGSVEDLVTR